MTAQIIDFQKPRTERLIRRFCNEYCQPSWSVEQVMNRFQQYSGKQIFPGIWLEAHPDGHISFKSWPQS